MFGEQAIDVRVQRPAVVLETAVLATGLPGTVRLEAIERMTAAARGRGAEPAFAGILQGRAVVGLNLYELETLAQHRRKLSTRDLPAAMAKGEHGGTTVAASVFLANRAGLPVVATGGIGGVHPSLGPPDVSADLLELARTPVVLVCSGAKAITDLPATLERLETLGVSVVGFETDEFPAFWTAESGLAVDVRVDSAAEVAEIWRRAQALQSNGALLVCVPPPAEVAMSKADSQAAVRQAHSELEAAGVSGPAITPFLLGRISELTDGRSLKANLALLENNAGVAAAISSAVHG